ncbi:MAG: peptidase dimerization domain-containing protein [Oscillospiraceae bacterium]|nr:peptidase dimerization domain-containing protein [Oscillospiraceae bacterium]
MNYTITIQGRGGHGSRPDRAYNPIDCFAAIYGILQQHQCPITRIDGGTANNVIPDKLIFSMEWDKSKENLESILDPACKLYHCSFEIEA